MVDNNNDKQAACEGMNGAGKNGHQVLIRCWWEETGEFLGSRPAVNADHIESYTYAPHQSTTKGLFVYHLISCCAVVLSTTQPRTIPPTLDVGASAQFLDLFLACGGGRGTRARWCGWEGCSCGWDLIHWKSKYLPFYLHKHFLGLAYLWFIDSHYISSTLNNKSSRIVKHQRTRSSYNSWFLSKIQMSCDNFYYMVLI